MQPEFSRLRAEAFAELTVRSTEQTLARWRNIFSPEEPINLAPEMTRLTLEVIVQALFTVDLDTRAPSLVDAITVLMEGLGEQANLTFNIPMMITPDGKRAFEAALAEVNAFCQEVIDERRQRLAQGDPIPPDLLGDLLKSTDPTLSDRDLRDEVVTMLISGHETTALILSWSWMLLAQAPEVEAELHAEVDALLDGRGAHLADVPHLVVTTRILQEAMRLYPPVWYIARRARVDARIAGIEIPKNDTVLICPYLIQRTQDLWPDAEQFNPNRFDPSRFPAPVRGSYIPFGAGRHTCLGQHIALLEGVLILATLARSIRVRPVHSTLPDMETTITLRPLGGLPATLEPRLRGPAGQQS
jgi:cytochrome P450